MDKNSGSGDLENTEMQIWPQEMCRFAYTIGNHQPVRCTWISDQPLFYSDYEGVIEDDDYLMDDPILQELERDIADLREKTNAYDKIAQEFVEHEDKKMELFRLDADFIASTTPALSGKLDDLLTLAHQSRLASQFLSFAQISNIEIRLSNQVIDASYDRETQTILVRDDLNQADQILLLSRELRRMYQHKNGAGLHPLTLHPDFAVLINRAQTADLLVSMIRIAWELQLSGYKDAWARIENSPLADLGSAFAREAITDFRSISNGLATRATFESWFLSERCRKADRILIQQMLADYQGYSFSDQAETSRMIALDMIKALGIVPFGQNYIESVAQQIMVDPVFTDVRDRSNANFLWFIKFERSFTEAEQEIAAEKATRPSASILAFPTQKKTQKASRPSNGQAAEIVDLYRFAHDS